MTPQLEDRRPGQIVVLTGERGSGKTTTCLRLVESARAVELDCAGIVSPGLFAGSVKVGIDVLDVRSGESRRLAEVDEVPARVRMGPYRFDDGAMAWGAERLGLACPCDLLIVDEIGPLELDRGEGWTTAFDILRQGEYGLAVAVVRPSLVTAVGALTAGSADVIGYVTAGSGAVDELLPLAVAAATRRRAGWWPARPPGG